MSTLPDCVFCKIIRGEIPSSKLYEDELVLAFLDIAPLAKGHTLVIPKNHHASITTVPEEVHGRMLATAARLGAALMRATDSDGFNLVLSNGACAGQVVPHTHLHIVPRHPEDGIALPTRTVAYADDEERDEILEQARRRIQEG
jgi:histidine triad (HIT) family protein